MVTCLNGTCHGAQSVLRADVKKSIELQALSGARPANAMVLAGAQSARGSPAPGHEMQSQPMPHAHHQPEPQPALTMVMPSGGCNAPSVWVLTEMLRLEGWMFSHHRVLEIQKLSLKCEDLWSKSSCQ